MTIQEYATTAYEYTYDFTVKIPGRVGFAVGFALEAGRMFARNIMTNLPAMLQITANFARTWFGTAIGTAGILALTSIASPAISVGLLFLGQAGFSFPLRLAVASAFAGVMSGFQWRPADPRQPSFLKGLATYLAPFTMLTLAIAKPVLLGLGILREKTYTFDLNGQTISYVDIQNPIESTEVADEHLDRAVGVGKVAVNEMIATGNQAKAIAETFAADAAIVARDIRDATYSTVTAPLRYVGVLEQQVPAVALDINTVPVAVEAGNDPVRARVDAMYANVNSAVSAVRSGLYYAFVQTPGEALGLLDPTTENDHTDDFVRVNAPIVTPFGG
ncbi:MAG TPA: hypothetical protein VLG38_04075 [Gammaproteobacteria bacterium]|nr:hypothetical protein [Gammaproteobacteria bacterium]